MVADVIFKAEKIKSWGEGEEREEGAIKEVYKNKAQLLYCIVAYLPTKTKLNYLTSKTHNSLCKGLHIKTWHALYNYFFFWNL